MRPSDDEATTHAKLSEASRPGDDKRGMMLLLDFSKLLTVMFLRTQPRLLHRTEVDKS
jgi:hypothetical protein